MTKTKIMIWLFAVLTSTARSMAAEYAPTTNWPYVNEDFKDGVMVLADSTRTDAIPMNIHLHGNILQCVNMMGSISRVTFANIDHVVIDGKEYRYVGESLMQCLHSDGDNRLMLSVEADFENMLRSQMPYGMQGGTITTMDLRKLDLHGEHNERYTEMKAVWYDGKVIPLIETYIFVIGDTTVPATSKGCNAILTPEQRKQLKALVKENKIDWRSTEDLKKVLAFMKNINK